MSEATAVKFYTQVGYIMSYQKDKKTRNVRQSIAYSPLGAP